MELQTKNKMITREEYNKALDIVEAYHKQLFIDSVSDNLRDLGNTHVLKWDKFHECSARLKSALILADYYNREYGHNYFIETINRDSFRKIRNAGNKTWAEFVRLRGY